MNVQKNERRPSLRAAGAPQTPAQEAPTTEPPRNFVVATGYIFQSFGLLVLLISCVLWAYSGEFMEPVSEPFDSWRELLTPGRAPALLSGAGLVVSFLGGSVLIATGVGLQGERPTGGRAAMWAAGLLAVTYTVLAAVAAVFIGVSPSMIATAVLAAASIVLFMLAGYSNTLLRQHPPPQDQNVVTDEWIEQYREKRRKKMTVYPSADRWDEFDE